MFNMTDIHDGSSEEASASETSSAAGSEEPSPRTPRRSVSVFVYMILLGEAK